jgi:peroxiredoxin/glutaredoxin
MSDHNLKNIEGEKVPEVKFQVREDGKWETWTTEGLFKGKKVIVFALPGAFTPTCSSTHLPRYNDLAAQFKKSGVDTVICLSVNDTFVMNAWKESQEAENITFLPDGNGEFSKGMGMLVDKTDIGFGPRSWRYSMLVNDGVIEKMFIEPDVPGDPFEVSDADTMLDYVQPGAERPKEITLFSKPGCPHCARAKEILESKGIKYTEIKGARTTTLRSLGGKGTYPLVFINGENVGGADELENVSL